MKLSGGAMPVPPNAASARMQIFANCFSGIYRLLKTLEKGFESYFELFLLAKEAYEDNGNELMEMI